MQNRSDTEKVTRGTDAKNMHFARKVLIYPILLEHLLSSITLISVYLFDFFATPLFCSIAKRNVISAIRRKKLIDKSDI